MNDFEIRRAKTSDANRLSNLLYQLGYETHAQKIATLLSALSLSGPSLSGSSNSTDDVFVGVEQGVVVAFISLIYFDYFPSAEKVCRITALVVDENIRSSGIGTKLVEYAKLEAVTKECEVLEVTTSLKRKKTQEYYEGIGFQKTSYKYIQRLNFSSKN